jgi:hypothetical protein
MTPSLSYRAAAFLVATSIVLPLMASSCAHAQSTAASKGVTIKIDVQARRRPISPLVYGVNYAGKNADALNCPINRYGGNNTSRYNWRQNADNRANDWFFQSIGDDDPTPSGRVLNFVKENKAQREQSMVTVPLTGWVAKINPDHSKTWSFSVKKYGPQEKTDAQWVPDAGNGMKPDGKTPLTGNNPNDANVRADTAYMRPWIESLTRTFGPSGKGGIAYYVLDNEPGIWHSTHRDIWPTGIKMDDLWARSRDMARMIKTVDPTAKIAGPEEWGWTNYLYSGFDSQWSGKNGWGNLPDRAAHGGIDMMPWYLQQFARAEKEGGKRLLDVFSLHFYPQGGEFGADTSEQMQLRRNRSTRALWDPNYTDETWIRDKVRLVPRMKEWVARYYPGTKTALTEYSWGADEHINGATAQADILGILGREGLDIGTRWVCPDPKTPTFKAFQLYRNYDGKNGTFGDVSVACDAPDPDTVSAFAAQDSNTGALTVMIVAKTPGAPPTPVTLDPAGFTPGVAAARVYRLTAKNTIERQPDVSLSGPRMTLIVPAQSVTLVVLPKK